MPAPDKLIALKIDVDTLEGYLGGVPALLDLFGRLGVPATFCVTVGPDCSGRAIRRVFTRPGFLRKMLRTGAVSMYGPRTMMYGTLLPAPYVPRRNPALIHQALAAGHEVIPHGWNHVDWHDFLLRWDAARTGRELDLACEELAAITGQPCQAFAAPGWQATEHSLLAQEARGMLYSADTRGWAPFFPVIGGRALRTLQMPTTLPTLDELAGRPDLAGVDMLDHVHGLISAPPALPGQPAPRQVPPLVHIYTGHTEVEGRGWLKWFGGLLARLASDGFAFLTLGELAAWVQARDLADPGAFVQGTLPGRAGTVTCQASLPSAAS
jgi:undecaprenyl phosphate-alpha-L-ara4FN deformylase